MVIQQLKESGYEIFPDKGENAYKVILHHPNKCAQCGASVNSVGFSKARSFIEMYNGNPRTVFLRCSRYRCSKKYCNAYAYTGRDNPITLYLDVSGKISLEVKLAAVREKMSNPSLSSEEICEKYKISRSTLQKELSYLYDRAEMVKPRWIADCDHLILWPIVYKGRTRGCLFGIDTSNHKIGLVDIISPDDYVYFFQKYGVMPKDCSSFSGACNVILKMDESIFMALPHKNTAYQITITEEEYDKYERHMATLISLDHLRRLNEMKPGYSDDQNNLEMLLRDIEESEKDEFMWKRFHIEEYARWIRNSVQFDRDYIESILLTMRKMWDDHLSDREILLHFVFTGALLNERLRCETFDIMCR